MRSPALARETALGPLVSLGIDSKNAPLLHCLPLVVEIVPFGYGCCYNTLPLSGPGHSDPGQRYELIPPLSVWVRVTPAALARFML